MTSAEVVDAELATLYAKVEQLIKERDGALELAERAAVKLSEARANAEHYRHLFLRKPLQKRYEFYRWLSFMLGMINIALILLVVAP
jgi:hypothetical protein